MEYLKINFKNFISLEFFYVFYLVPWFNTPISYYTELKNIYLTSFKTNFCFKNFLYFSDKIA